MNSDLKHPKQFSFCPLQGWVHNRPVFVQAATTETYDLGSFGAVTHPQCHAAHGWGGWLGSLRAGRCVREGCHRTKPMQAKSRLKTAWVSRSVQDWWIYILLIPNWDNNRDCVSVQRGRSEADQRLAVLHCAPLTSSLLPEQNICQRRSAAMSD